MHRILILLILLLTAGLALNTQDNPPPAPQPTQTNVPPPPAVGVDEDFSAGNAPVNTPPFDPQAVPTKTQLELSLSIAVLVFGAVVTLALLFFIARRTKESSLDQLIDIIKYPVVLVIIVGGLFLVTAGYGNEQIAPIIGLMGTIAGYLMGRSRNGAA
ncbi:hypothetical protein CEQ90_03590 [Lewinellaceae bacterium SD302]|nr:hypothetical protein CEQ90_03590 [Lewinellaceae bacterium SD302]